MHQQPSLAARGHYGRGEGKEGGGEMGEKEQAQSFFKGVFQDAFGHLPLVCEKHNVRSSTPNAVCDKCEGERVADELTALRAQVSALQTENRTQVLAITRSCTEIEILRGERDEAARKAKHWKDQHANEVKRARILKDTTDLSLERVRAYELMGELQGQVELYKETLRLEQEDHALCRQNKEAEWRRATAAGSERDQLRAEVERLNNRVVELETEEGLWLPQYEGLRRELSTATEKGAESMRDKAAGTAYSLLMRMGYTHRAIEVEDMLRALPLKENEG